MNNRKAKPNELLAQWDKAFEDIEWPHSGNPHFDLDALKLVRSAICGQHVANWHDHTRQPSLVEALEKMGYDLSTLRFSIQKKPIPPENES